MGTLETIITITGTPISARMTTQQSNYGSFGRGLSAPKQYTVHGRIIRRVLTARQCITFYDRAINLGLHVEFTRNQ